MITKNKNEKNTESIFDIYKCLGVSRVTKNLIVINHTHQREKHAKLFYSLVVGLLFLFTILSYNKQNFISFLGTVLFTCIVLIYSKYKYQIWYKEIVFDTLKGTVSYKRNFPKKNIHFNFDAIYITSEQYRLKSYHTLYYYLKKISKTKDKKKHSLFTGYTFEADNNKELFVKLLEQFMRQGYLPKELKLYPNNVSN